MRTQLVLLSIGLMYLANPSRGSSAEEASDPALPNVRVSYVSFDSVGTTEPIRVAAKLSVPQGGQTKSPAVVIVHGSNGVDSRGTYHAQSLNENGIATLEIDLWAARGNYSGAAERPKGVPETLPDAFGALGFLAKLPFIDADKIGIMGFSWGGVVTLLSATTPYRDASAPQGLSFAAHVAFYPVCWGYNVVPGYAFQEITDAPILILAGALDTYDDPTSCSDLVASLEDEARENVTVHVYPDATHAWNMQGDVDRTIVDPFAHKGRGGEVRFRSNPEVADDSRLRTNTFFQDAFGMADR